MLKKIALAVMLIIPMGMFAQTMKFGHLYSQEIIVLMPEYTSAVNDMQALQKKFTEEMQRTEEEFTKKYQEFQQAMADGTLPQNIQERRQKELQDMYERSQQFQQEASQEMEKKQQDLMAPIFKKVNDAIAAVGQEENMVYIFDLSTTSIPFVNDKLSTDVSSKVKAKVGVK